MHQQALLPLAENLNESETLFISPKNLLATKWPSSLILKRTQLNKISYLISYLYRDRMDFTPARHAAEHFVAGDYGGC